LLPPPLPPPGVPVVVLSGADALLVVVAPPLPPPGTLIDVAIVPLVFIVVASVLVVVTLTPSFVCVVLGPPFVCVAVIPPLVRVTLVLTLGLVCVTLTPPLVCVELGPPLVCDPPLPPLVRVTVVLTPLVCLEDVVVVTFLDVTIGVGSARAVTVTVLTMVLTDAVGHRRLSSSTAGAPCAVKDEIEIVRNASQRLRENISQKKECLSK